LQRSHAASLNLEAAMADIVTPTAAFDGQDRTAGAWTPIRSLRALAIAAGLCSAILFVVVGVSYHLQMYGDGSIFSYSVAVEDAWAFHSHNIPGRLFTYIYSLAPAEAYVHLTHDAGGGISLYGFLFFAAQLLGLIATFAADRSKGHVIATYACGSTACLCPLVFGFPTETWMAHALFWPTLALCHYTPRGIRGTVVLFFALLMLVFTYEGAVAFAIAIVATLLLRGMRNAAFIRAASALFAVLLIWVFVKAAVPPDDYYAIVLTRAEWHVFDPSLLTDDLLLLLFGALVSYGIVFYALQRLRPASPLYSVLIVTLALVVHWVWFDQALHAENRYYMRTALLIAIPIFGGLSAAYASRVDADLIVGIPRLPGLLSALANDGAVRLATGALALVMLIHTVETAKFVTAWAHYTAAVRALATGTTSDPALGDSHFVSSRRIEADLNRLSWFSTTQFLSVLVAPDFAPARLVIDPRRENYFWLPCKVATANENADRAIPVESRRLIRVHSCQHR
jgi:hypothetical protein